MKAKHLMMLAVVLLVTALLLPLMGAVPLTERSILIQIGAALLALAYAIHLYKIEQKSSDS
ncbi:hypothetical protein [Alkalicoccus chagannorensis]|uniref:hypothetical protein n=1 Tax=Alkalicoccus chagannorensis TaxID=427072 RepID=UPI00047C9860|nr:hypothetical protein [Alkalicoccus chagannorensis]